MSTRIYGDLEKEGVEVVRRDSRLFVRYDAGAHLAHWREDEITEDEFRRLSATPEGYDAVQFDLQRRLIASGVNPYIANWNPHGEEKPNPAPGPIPRPQDGSS